MPPAVVFMQTYIFYECPYSCELYTFSIPNLIRKVHISLYTGIKLLFTALLSFIFWIEKVLELYIHTYYHGQKMILLSLIWKNCISFNVNICVSSVSILGNIYLEIMCCFILHAPQHGFLLRFDEFCACLLQ